jgi:Ni/Co efflux regulator RcnB
MYRLISVCLVTAMISAGFTATSAEAQYRPKDAKNMCKDQVRSQYGAHDTSNVSVETRGRDRYLVSGYAKRSGRSAYFRCKVRNGYIRDMEIGRWEGGGDGGKTAVAVGAAVILGAAIAAAASDKHSHDHDRYDEYDHHHGDRYDRDDARYSPAPGITCHRWQRACYKDGAGFSPKWTNREF